MAYQISDSVIEEIKSRTDICELISSYSCEIKTKGGAYWACCPFHHEKTPSFKIDPNKGIYHCFGCGKHGDIITFVQEIDGLSFSDAVAKLAERCNVDIQVNEDPSYKLRKRLYALMAQLAAFYHRCLLQTKEAAIAREYLKSRDLDESAQEIFTIGYAPAGSATVLEWAKRNGFTMDEMVAAGVLKAPDREGDRPYHRFSGRLMFTIKDKQGRVVAFSGRQLVENKKSGKYVNSPETLIFKKSNVLFGFDKASGNIARMSSREAIVCEGQIDTIRLHISGFSTAVASQGTAFTEIHAKMLAQVADSVLLVFDNDNAGRKASVKTARLLLAAGLPVKVVSLPDGHDPDSFLREKGAAEFSKILSQARSIIEFQVESEKLLEENPSSIDAVMRISRNVLETVSYSSSSILRATMLGEASKFLNVPVGALNEDYSNYAKKKNLPQKPSSPHQEEDKIIGDNVPIELEQEDSKTQKIKEDFKVPPPKLEMDIMKFLLFNEEDDKVCSIAQEWLIPQIFIHDFTKRFHSAWLKSSQGDSDSLPNFQQSLDVRELAWFDDILVGSDMLASSESSQTDIAKQFVRFAWKNKFERMRGTLPVNGGREADEKRLLYSLNAKRVLQLAWNSTKDLIEQFKKGIIENEQYT
jgi:DNA primase